jgi:hypothetical protein
LEDGDVAVLVETRQNGDGLLIAYHDAHTPASVREQLNGGEHNVG